MTPSFVHLYVVCSVKCRIPGLSVQKRVRHQCSPSVTTSQLIGCGQLYTFTELFWFTKLKQKDKFVFTATDPHPAKCDKLRSDTCSGLLPYDQIYPTSQNDFEPVIATLLNNNVTCGDTNLTQFVCSLMFQPCSDDGRSRVLCREYCDDVVSRCRDEYYNATSMPLEHVVQCSRFPDAGRSDQMFCYQGKQYGRNRIREWETNKSNICTN